MIFVSLIFITLNLLAARNNCFCDCSIHLIPAENWNTKEIRNHPIGSQRTGSLTDSEAVKSTVENLEYNINISRSLRDSIEGVSIWHIIFDLSGA